MTATSPTAAMVGDDRVIEAAVDQAILGALLPALAHVTGDPGLAPEHLRPNPDDIMDPQGGLTPEQLDEARALAVETLRGLRDGTIARADHPPTDDDLHRLVAHIVGDANVDAYHDLLLEELAPEGVDRRAPGWTADAVAPDTPFHVAIVGAGMSGLLAAHRLTQAGVRVTILEKNDDVGGTWFENTYPGCRVDVPNHLYSYSFAHAVWPQHFSDQATLLNYFRGCAEDFGVRSHVRFGTEVLGADWSDDTQTWTVRVRPTGPGAGDDEDGPVETIEANALISAVGQLNRPHLPEIDGIDTFAGPWFHSAEWRHDVDLTGKRVAVIGTGASAAQFIPEVAAQAAELVVFQRTPNWLAPTPDYHEDVADESRWLLEALPEYGDWYRLWLFWRMHEGLTAAAEVDPEWTSDTGTVSLLNELVRIGLVEYLTEQFADRPELRDRVVPAYPPIAKRIVRDNGIWARTLTSDHVHLVTDPIEAVTPTGVRAAGVDQPAVEHAVDVIIYGTGFAASQFLTPMRVTGRDGVDLHEHWAGDARAYLGITVPHFPNLFCLYGPNTNIVINGSIIFFSECEVRYLTECVHLLLATGHHALDVRPEVHDAFNERVDAANRQMAWGASSVNSWYKNATGRVSQNWPFSLLEYWRLTRVPDPDDYLLS